MKSSSWIVAGGICLILAALGFVGVFSYLAANFDYPDVLEGAAVDVLPRLRAGGGAMRAVWAIYAFLPLLLLPGATAAKLALPESQGRTTLALVAVSIGALAMCLGLARWPSVHWELAEAYARAGPESREAIAAVFSGLNTYLGNYLGEFLGEVCLGLFFLLTALALQAERRVPIGLGWSGVAVGTLVLVGAFRNAVAAVQPVADLNNLLLPAWLVVLGVVLVRLGRSSASLE